MFDDIAQGPPVTVRWERTFWEPLGYDQVDDAKTELIWLEAQSARIRARQTEILAWLSEKRAHRVDAARSIEEWTAAVLDVEPRTARDLVKAARHGARRPLAAQKLADGDVSFDRAVAVARLVEAGGDDADVAASSELDLTGVRRRTAELTRLTVVDEAETMRRRHLTLVPTLGDSAWKVSGLLPAVAGRLVAKALQERADQFPSLADGSRVGLAERQADALTALAMDWLDGDTGDEPDRTATGGTDITVFVDAATLACAGGERGATIAGGPRIGPETLDRLLCGGSVSLVAIDERWRPVAVTDGHRVIPPSVRAAVLHRDGGCVVDGCRSRYRLEVHHLHPRAHGGGHEPDNLVALCWFHHHIAVHELGFYFAEDTPPRRRRLTRRPRAPDLAA